MKATDEICTMGQDKLVKFVGVVAVLAVIGMLLCSCGPSGPTEDDMKGCATGNRITYRDVADCAVYRDRAARHEGEAK